ncbi:MAG: addiction module protein [Verrucomicrobiota bacterium]
MTGIDQLRELPVSERIQLVEDLWDTIAVDSESIRLTEAQTTELNRRLDRFEEDPSVGIEWSDLKARISNSL